MLQATPCQLLQLNFETINDGMFINNLAAVCHHYSRNLLPPTRLQLPASRPLHSRLLCICQSRLPACPLCPVPALLEDAPLVPFPPGQPLELLMRPARVIVHGLLALGIKLGQRKVNSTLLLHATGQVAAHRVTLVNGQDIKGNIHPGTNTQHQQVHIFKRHHPDAHTLWHRSGVKPLSHTATHQPVLATILSPCADALTASKAFPTIFLQIFFSWVFVQCQCSRNYKRALSSRLLVLCLHVPACPQQFPSAVSLTCGFACMPP